MNPYTKKTVPGSILNIVEEINFDSEGKQRQFYGYGISAKRYYENSYDRIQPLTQVNECNGDITTVRS